MPVTYQILPQHELFIAYFRGTVVDDEFIQACREIFSSPLMQPGFRNIAYAPGETDIQLTEKSLLNAMAQSIEFHGCGFQPRSVHVLQSDSAEKISEIYQAMAMWNGEYTEEIEVYQTLEEAFKSLGVSLAALAELEECPAS